MTLREDALNMHRIYQGSLETVSKVAVRNAEDSPGVAEPCKEPETVYDYTMKGNTVAVVSDGTAVLGLGNIDPEAFQEKIKKLALIGNNV